MAFLGWITLGAAAFIALIALEGWRQGRKYGSSGRGASLMRAGMVEMQVLLEPEKKMEILKVEPKEDFQFAIKRSSEPPEPPAPSRAP